MPFPHGYTGMQQQTIDGVPQTPGPIDAPVSELGLPAIQLDSGQSRENLLRGFLDGSASPMPRVASTSSSRFGSLLGLSLQRIGNSFVGMKRETLQQPVGYAPYAGTTSTATWTWRIYL